jgi:hypothetical protein
MTRTRVLPKKAAIAQKSLRFLAVKSRLTFSRKPLPPWHEMHW